MNTCVCFYDRLECNLPCIYQTEKCFGLEINGTYLMLNINFPQLYSLEDKQKGTSAPEFLCCAYILNYHIQHVDTFKFGLKSCKTNGLCMEAYVHFAHSLNVMNTLNIY
jgi:hypothetical protein